MPGDHSHTESIGDCGLVYHVESPRAPFNPGYRVLYPTRFLFPYTALQRILTTERPELVEVSDKYTMPYLAGLLRTRRLTGIPFRPTTVGLSCWSDRVFYLTDEGDEKSLSLFWRGKYPGAVNRFISLMGLLKHRRIRSALRVALNEHQEFAR